MTETTNTDAAKRRILMVAMVLAALVAIPAIVAAVMAKPAEAATCASSAFAPHRDPDYKDNWLFAPGRVSCTGTNNYMSEIYVKVQLQRQNANGGWSVLRTATDYHTNYFQAWADAKIDCGTTYTWATYRTVTTGYTVAPNGYLHSYGPTYSSRAVVWC
jgi:hypothetical protein